jgi:hypothetical protein
LPPPGAKSFPKRFSLSKPFCSQCPGFHSRRSILIFLAQSVTAGLGYAIAISAYHSHLISRLPRSLGSSRAGSRPAGRVPGSRASALRIPPGRHRSSPMLRLAVRALGSFFLQWVVCFDSFLRSRRLYLPCSVRPPPSRVGRELAAIPWILFLVPSDSLARQWILASSCARLPPRPLRFLRVIFSFCRRVLLPKIEFSCWLGFQRALRLPHFVSPLNGLVPAASAVLRFCHRLRFCVRATSGLGSSTPVLFSSKS